MDPANDALSLAMAPTAESAAAFIKTLSLDRALQLAAALGLGTASDSAGSRLASLLPPLRAALRSAASWCRKYRELRAANAAACRAKFAKAARRTFGEGPSPRALALLEATAHFTNESAGTAVALSPHLLLTCAHCVSAAGDPEEGEGAPQPSRLGRLSLLLLFGGAVVVARCIAADEGRDLALLRVVASGGGAMPAVFPRVAQGRVDGGTRVLCVGNPSEFDLERGGGRRIHFKPPVFHCSAGRVVGPTAADRAGRGLGGAQHSCWTYWGHSGSALVDRDGRICCVHSSWDDETGTRHGVGGAEVGAFMAAWAAPAAAARGAAKAGDKRPREEA